MCDCLKMSISFRIRVSIVCPFDGGVTQKVRMRIISLAIEFHAMTPMQDVSIKFAANVQGLPQAVEFIDISGGGATTNIILFMRRSQHPAEGGTGLPQAICCAKELLLMIRRRIRSKNLLCKQHGISCCCEPCIKRHL